MAVDSRVYCNVLLLSTIIPKHCIIQTKIDVSLKIFSVTWEITGRRKHNNFLYKVSRLTTKPSRKETCIHTSQGVVQCTYL